MLDCPPQDWYCSYIVINKSCFSDFTDTSFPGAGISLPPGTSISKDAVSIHPALVSVSFAPAGLVVGLS